MICIIQVTDVKNSLGDLHWHAKKKKRIKLLFLERLEDEKERLAKRRCCEQFSVDTRYAPFLLQEFIGLTTFFVHLYRFIYTFQHCPRTRFLTSIRWAKSTESSNYCTNYHHMIMKSGKSSLKKKKSDFQNG